jgi:hypothetical protein
MRAWGSLFGLSDVLGRGAAEQLPAAFPRQFDRGEIGPKFARSKVSLGPNFAAVEPVEQ